MPEEKIIIAQPFLASNLPLFYHEKKYFYFKFFGGLNLIPIC